MVKGGHQQLTDEEIIARSNRCRWRWRAAIRFVIRNLYWLSDVEGGELGDDVRRNVQLLTQRKDKKGLLTLQDKAILNKPAEWRAEDEKAHLARILAGLKCFRRYPSHVRVQLAATSYFRYYGPGRVIVRQGHKPYGCFFIVTGEVIISNTAFDPVLNKEETRDVAVMGAESMFGDVSILHNIRRTGTVTTMTHCELLLLRKKEFDVILKESLQKEWDNVKSSMRLFSYFDEWDEISLRECCLLSKMKRFRPDHTILGDEYGQKDFTYFILRGQCRVIEHLLVTTSTCNGRKCYRRYNPQNAHLPTASNTKVQAGSDRRLSGTPKPEASAGNIIHLTVKSRPKPSRIDLPPNVETYFMQVCYLNALGCFAIGESMKNRRVVSVTPVECLLIPRYWLMQNRNMGNLWGRIQQFLNKHIPNNEEVFRTFVDQRRRTGQRKEMVRQILAQKKLPNDNSMVNVPYFVRLTEPNEER